MMDINVALISPNSNSASETFVRAHIERLDAKVFTLYGGYLPTHSTDGTLKFSSNFFSRILKNAGLLKTKFSDAQLAVIKFLECKKIDLVFAEYGPSGVAMTAICSYLKLPLVVHFHGYDAHKTDITTLYEKGYAEMFRKSAKIISVSHSMTEKLVLLGADREKIIYNPCGPSEIYLDNQYNRQVITFFAVGRFTSKKAPYLTLAAFKILAEKYPEAKLIMAGNHITAGDLSEVCMRLAKIWGLSNVAFKGALSSTEVLGLMGNSFCFLQHSITALNGDAEGTPVAILEAGLAGLPVVSTNHEGIVDVVIEGITGFLVDEGDVSGMADRMIRLYENRDLAKSLGKNARNHILENYTMKRHISILNEVIKDADFS